MRTESAILIASLASFSCLAAAPDAESAQTLAPPTDAGLEDDASIRIFLDGAGAGAKPDAGRRDAGAGSGGHDAGQSPPHAEGGRGSNAEGGRDAETEDAAASRAADADAGTATARSCSEARMCVRAGGSLGFCLEDASAEARVQAETLIACEEGICFGDCGRSSPLATCNGCLLSHCALALEACAQAVEVDAAPTDVAGSIDAVPEVASVDAESLSDAGNEAECGAPCVASICGDGVVQENEECDDGNSDPFDRCSNRCEAAAEHLLITEVVTRPNGAEMIEIFNPTREVVALSDYGVSDNHLYYRVAIGSFSTSSGSDFAARFPEGSAIAPGGYRTVAVANADGGSTSFRSVYGKKPDFELRPLANGASDDPEVPNMRSATAAQSIGATATLTDAGEPIVLFFHHAGDRIYDVDYLYYGAPSASNPPVDKTGVTAGSSSYLPDTSVALQSVLPSPGDGGSLHRCSYAEPGEPATVGNGITGHDATAEALRDAFVVNASTAAHRTPGGPPPAGICP